MSENGTDKKLTYKQQRAIEALFTSATVTEAADQAGVAERTLYRWLKQPHFQAALDGEIENSNAETLRLLIAGRPRALHVLYNLMQSARGEQTRRGCAKDWLELGMQYYSNEIMRKEIAEIAQELQEIKELLNVR